MAWYWWVATAIAIVILLSLILGRKRDGGADGSHIILEGPQRQASAVREAERYAEATIAFLADLEIVSDAPPGESQPHETVAANLRGFFRRPHVQTHVVAGSRSLALVQQAGGHRDESVTREIVRIDHDRWSVRTFASSDFKSAIQAAEAKDQAEARRQV